jgi:hypothetical protein
LALIGIKKRLTMRRGSVLMILKSCPEVLH